MPFFPIEAYLAHTLMSLLLINQLFLLLEFLLITTQSILVCNYMYFCKEDQKHLLFYEKEVENFHKTRQGRLGF